MTFAHPAIAVLSALIVPVAFITQGLFRSVQRRSAYAYSNLTFMTGALGAPEWPNVAIDLACAASFTLLLAAAAGPRVASAVPAAGAVVICIDTSGSMNAHDVRPSRAIAALRAVHSFIHAAPSATRIALVSFAGDAQRIVALTSDRDAVLRSLARIPSPNGQTAIGDGLLAAAAMLPEAGAREIVLLTDGVNNRGEDPRHVLSGLAASHVRLHVIAIGDAAPSQRLRAYAAETGGIFARAGNAGDLRTEMLHLAAAGSSVRIARDYTMPCVIMALTVGAAAWFAAAGAARP